jgi:hypothetical protein
MSNETYPYICQYCHKHRCHASEIQSHEDRCWDNPKNRPSGVGGDYGEYDSWSGDTTREMGDGTGKPL